GDDALFEPGSFESEACAALRAAAQRLPVYFMQGNRDFLTGHQFLEHCGVTGLADPTLLIFDEQRFVLSHGDLLCLDDVDYQRFRLLARSAPWQSQFLAQPLVTRRAQARGIRQESEARKQTSPQAGSPTGMWYADLDGRAVLAWLKAAGARTMIHGHTHRPATHDVADGMQRIVLSDWDAAAHPPRAEVLRLTRTGIERQTFMPLQGC
ncbi:MAG: UDP-2,3-diacylglucosamine diphosphatase, partial [Burkholderiaceae bacterium]|nr:UDP-2,3-diacylglucosamine diphosphatase [Burkholderiaceae bacterium]